jgi:hypothetical protein
MSLRDALTADRLVDGFVHGLCAGRNMVKMSDFDYDGGDEATSGAEEVTGGT